MPTQKECKSILFKLGVKYGVNPTNVSQMLLSAEDKEDMLHGKISNEALDTAVRVWVDSRMPNYGKAQI